MNPPSDAPDDLVLLCPNCHKMATEGALSPDEQRWLKSNPVNVREGYASGRLKINQRAIALTVGSNQFIGDGCILRVDDMELLRLDLNENGGIEITVELRDEMDRLLARIERNEWRTEAPMSWDLECRHHWLTIRSGPGVKILDIDAREYPISLVADLWSREWNIKLDKEMVFFKGVNETLGFSNICFVGTEFVVNTAKPSIGFGPDPKRGRAVFVSDPDVETRVEKGLMEWDKMIAQG